MLSIATKMFARVEDAVHGLCSCSSFSGSCFRPFRRYVSFRNFCVGGQSIHVTFSTRAADMYTDMPIVDRGATATSGIRAQNVNLVDLVKSFLHVTSISYLLAKCGRAARSRDPPPRRYKFRAATSHPLRRSHEVCAAMRWAFFLFMVQTCSSFQTCKAVKGR